MNILIFWKQTSPGIENRKIETILIIFKPGTGELLKYAPENIWTMVIVNGTLVYLPLDTPPIFNN